MRARRALRSIVVADKNGTLLRYKYDVTRKTTSLLGRPMTTVAAACFKREKPLLEETRARVALIREQTGGEKRGR